MLFFVVTFDTANPEKRPNSQTSAKNTVKKDEYFKQREEEIAQRKKEAEGVCSNSVVCVCIYLRPKWVLYCHISSYLFIVDMIYRSDHSLLLSLHFDFSTFKFLI